MIVGDDMKNIFTIEKLMVFMQEILKKMHNSEQVFYSNEYLSILNIAKFLFKYERNVFKDSSNEIPSITFDINNYEYLFFIMDVAEYIKKRGKFLLNGIIVNINTKNEEISHSLKIVNLLRNALAHGDYEIDVEKQIIVINSSSDGKYPSFLKVDIPLYILDDSIFNINMKYYIKEIDKNYYYDNILKTDKYAFDKYIENIIFQNDKLKENMNNEIILKFNKYYEFIKNGDILNALKLLLDIYGDLKKVGPFDFFWVLLQNEINEILKLIKVNDECYKVAEKVANLLGKDSNSSFNNFLVLYNYSMLVFSNESINIDYRFVDTSKISFEFFDSNKDEFENLNKKIYNFNQIVVNNFEKIPDDKKRDELILLKFKNLLDNILLKSNVLESLNKRVVSSIRNGQFHGYFDYDENKIHVLDKKKIDEIKFEAFITFEDYYNLLNDISGDKKYTLETFFNVIKNFIDVDVYDEFMNIYRKYICSNYPIDTVLNGVLTNRKEK